MTIKECIDIVDNIKPNQYTIKDKVMWLSFIEEIIINEVLKTHEGYDGRYDDFSGYTEDKISVVLIVPSPYDRLYTEYLKMMIDKENGEVARYNNSAASYNTYMMEYKKHYNKTHMPLSSSDRRKMMPAKKTFPGLTDAEYENIKKDMTYILTEYFEGRMSNDRIYEVVNSFVQNNIDMLKGKAGYTPIKGVDYFNEADMEEIRDYLIKTVPVSDYNQNDETQLDYIKNKPNIKNSEYGGIVLGDIETNQAYSANSVVGGYLTQAGSKGYKILGFSDDPLVGNFVSSESAPITAHLIAVKDVSGLEPGQTVSIRTTSHYVSCGIITGLFTKENSEPITHDTSYVAVETFKEIQLKLETDPDDPEHFVMENYLTVDGHPELGDTIVAFNGVSFGEDCIAQERDTFSTGRTNKSLGQYGFTANRGNIAGYASATFNYQNKALANYTFAAGQKNVINAPISAAFNYNNVIDASYGFSCGVNGYIGVGSTFCFNSGLDNKIIGESPDSFICGHAGIIEDCTEAFVANYRNKAVSAKSVALFGVGNICYTDHAMRRGKYCNETNDYKYADIVGNGTDDNNRSNAYTLDWDGNAWYAGEVECTAVVMKSPSGKKFRITVDDDGALCTEEVL